MQALLEHVPPWLGGVGWLVVLAGYLMQRRAWVSMQSSIRNTAKGNSQVTISVNQSAPMSSAGGESPLAIWGSWASIVGLFLTLLPMVKAWLAAGA